MSYFAYLSYLSYLCYLAYFAYLSCLVYLAYVAYSAYTAYVAYLAYFAYLAYLVMSPTRTQGNLSSQHYASPRAVSDWTACPLLKVLGPHYAARYLRPQLVAARQPTESLQPSTLLAYKEDCYESTTRG